MFEEHMRKIISNWKSARRRNNNTKNTKGKGRRGKVRLTNGTGMFSLYQFISFFIINYTFEFYKELPLSIAPSKSKSACSDADEIDSEDENINLNDVEKNNSNVFAPGMYILFLNDLIM